MTKYYKHIAPTHSLIAVACFVITLLYSLSAFAAASCNKNTACPSENACKPNIVNGLIKDAKGNISSSCIGSETNDSCFMSLPVSFGGSYNNLHYRPNGAGGNSTPRNHYGSDIGGSHKTNINVYAAAEGVVKYVKTSGGGGRTIQIEHEKQCTGAKDKYYKTTYRHLLAYKVSNGQSVKKGDVIGIEGGSNAKSLGSPPCDNPEQSGMPGYTRAGCGSNYAIHLHFEVEQGRASGSSTQASASKIMQPYCSDLQSLCGCTADVSNCLGKGVSAFSSSDSATADGITTGDGGGSAGGDEDLAAEDASGDTECIMAPYLEPNECLFCGLFKTLFNSASVIAKTANDQLAVPSKNLVSVGFLIWLAFYILKNIASFSGTEPGKLIKGILVQGFRVAVIVLILTNSIYEVMVLTMNPVLQTGLGLTKKVFTATPSNQTCDTSAPYMQGIKGYDNGIAENADGGLSKTLGGEIICSIKSIEDSVSFLLSLGHYSVCLSFNDYALWYIIPHFGYLTTGLVLMIVGLCLLIGVPWLLIDCLLNICVASALIPCSIAAFAFKSTSKYIKIVWNFFMNAMFNFVFMSMIIFIIMSQLKDWIDYNSENNSVDPGIFVNPFRSDSLAWYGLGFFKIFAVIFFCYVFCDEAKSMADKFAQAPSLGGGKGIGRMVGGTMASAATSVRKPVAKIGGKVIGAGASAVGDMANSAFGNKYRSMKNHARGVALRAAGKVGLINVQKSQDANGNVTYKSTYNILGFQRTREISRDADGVWSSSKSLHRLSKAEKAFKQVQNADGSIGYVTKDGEKMNQRIDATTGNIIWETADGKNRLVADSTGKLMKYKRAQDNHEREVVIHRTVTNVNDAFMKTRTVTDSDGQVIKQASRFQNVSSKHITNSDGTTNMHAVRQMIAGAADKQQAAATVVAMTMASRGENLSNEFNHRSVAVKDNGTIEIYQINNDGSSQAISAKIVDDQMIITSRSLDKKGNVTIKTSNGIQTKTERFNKQEDGSYTRSVQYNFSNQTLKANKHFNALDADGYWGYNIDPKKAMKGFTKEDYDLHVQQIRSGKKHIDRKLTTQNVINHITGTDKYGEKPNIEALTKQLNDAKSEQTVAEKLVSDAYKDKKKIEDEIKTNLEYLKIVDKQLSDGVESVKKLDDEKKRLKEENVKLTEEKQKAQTQKEKDEKQTRINRNNQRITIIDTQERALAKQKEEEARKDKAEVQRDITYLQEQLDTKVKQDIQVAEAARDQANKAVKKAEENLSKAKNTPTGGTAPKDLDEAMVYHVKNAGTTRGGGRIYDGNQDNNNDGRDASPEPKNDDVTPKDDSTSKGEENKPKGDEDKPRGNEDKPKDDDVRNLEDEAKAKEKEAREAEARAKDAETKAKEAEAKAKESEAKAKEAGDKAREAEARAKNAQSRLQETQAKLKEAQALAQSLQPYEKYTEDKNGNYTLQRFDNENKLLSEETGNKQTGKYSTQHFDSRGKVIGKETGNKQSGEYSSENYNSYGRLKGTEKGNRQSGHFVLRSYRNEGTVESEIVGNKQTGEYTEERFWFDETLMSTTKGNEKTGHYSKELYHKGRVMEKTEGNEKTGDYFTESYNDNGTIKDRVSGKKEPDIIIEAPLEGAAAKLKAAEDEVARLKAEVQQTQTKVQEINAEVNRARSRERDAIDIAQKSRTQAQDAKSKWQDILTKSDNRTAPNNN